MNWLQRFVTPQPKTLKTPLHHSFCFCAVATGPEGELVCNCPKIEGLPEDACYCCGSTEDLRRTATGGPSPLCNRCSDAKYPDLPYEPHKWAP